ncbi:TIR domain-containing protein [Vibrio splendidus]|uniref:TIR domain-containing protein n=1 Tax=Vibrio TaxID=662 RepID=UPI000C834294|nr:TIR domain-containing protein [Vibrio splendidus]MDH5911034.1 TIR domain-containing protein [Vibrio splendidus]MDH5944135.1 TIR domain-containing protein [Vibrio splendidus]MDH5984581.1 TIR domain-containing protein [Vibrio splendidus]MDH5991678.1 TIR domain-containing protein [Vibrio splendidus]MDH6006907.1 TIR domain-containing protein [Vibrio splendidus]
MYRLFISHSWAYSDAYDKVTKLIDDQGLSYYNHSVPMNDPIHSCGTDRQLRAAIDAKVKNTSCVLILAGVYSSYSKWIQIEIEIAQYYGKPIIAIEPWASEKTSKVVKDAAHKVVKWQGKSIVDAIKELA